jgi:cytochrome P450
MTLRPEVAKKGQAELDKVIGPDRLPALRDRKNLPYINAILKEVLRSRPVTPLGMKFCDYSRAPLRCSSSLKPSRIRP